MRSVVLTEVVQAELVKSCGVVADKSRATRPVGFKQEEHGDISAC